MKFLLDFFPIICFFVTFKLTGLQAVDTASWMNDALGWITAGTPFTPKDAPILAATLVTMLATLALLVFTRVRGHKIEVMQWVSLAIIVVFGGATLFLHDESFIKMKPTVLYGLLALALAGSRLLMKKNGIQAMLSAQVHLPSSIWDRLLWSWVVFFISMGILNIWVARHFSTSDWVDFKLFGTLGATLVFVIAQSIFIARHARSDTNETRS
ncbi:MAG: septation protein A [Burkholderiaceae bacterium]|jgi:intracellular septation protein